MRRIKGEKCYLTDLKIGQICKILYMTIEDKDLRRHLLEMGLTANTIVKIKKIAPLGEPVIVELRGYELFLEKDTLKRIYVEVI